MRYDTVTGSSVTIGREIARGGEGAIHEIAGDTSRVAKIYHAPVNSERAAKLTAMASVRAPKIETICAWPLDMLRDSSGKPAGIIMPAIRNAKDIHSLYGPRSRLREFPAADYRFLVATAANLARAFAVIHDHGHVIGDVNDRLAMILPDATVRLIDCDSFQVSIGTRIYRCDVGVLTHQPPDLQGISSFHGVTRTANHDNFGLAVLIFQLLFLARHPFSGRPLDSDNLPIDRAIREHRFAYGSRARQLRIEAPPNALRLPAVGQAVSLLFERAFAAESVGDGRPRAQEWADTLQHLASSLGRCQRNPNHWYLRGPASCPLCAIETATGAVLFLRPTVGGSFPGAFTEIDTDHLWAAIEAVLPLGAPSQPPSLSVFPVKARPRTGGAVRIFRMVLAIWIGIAVFMPADIHGLLRVILGGAAWWLWPWEDADAVARQRELGSRLNHSQYATMVAMARVAS
jgi:DNA-binding helix-hairpin-helix protein with protein kinase domain